MTENGNGNGQRRVSDNSRVAKLNDNPWFIAVSRLAGALAFLAFTLSAIIGNQVLTNVGKLTDAVGILLVQVKENQVTNIGQEDRLKRIENTLDRQRVDRYGTGDVGRRPQP